MMVSTRQLLIEFFTFNEYTKIYQKFINGYNNPRVQKNVVQRGNHCLVLIRVTYYYIETVSKKLHVEKNVVKKMLQPSQQISTL